MLGITPTPYFGHRANAEERERVQTLVAEHMPEALDQFDGAEVVVMDSKKEVLFENLRTLAKLQWARLTGKPVASFGLQTYPSHPEKDANREEASRLAGFSSESVSVEGNHALLTRVSSL